MTKISIVINADTREGFTNTETSASRMFNGCRNMDFLIDGVRNKIKFFEGFDREVILFIDEHEKLPDGVTDILNKMVNTLYIRKHTSEPGFNDRNYIRALELATGNVIAHFDQDCAAYARKRADVPHQFIELLGLYDYISYPSKHSPAPVEDESFDHWWVSTRFFMCKREILDFPEIKKCLDDAEHTFSKYPANRQCHWTEHILGLISKYKGKGVYYLPMEPDLYSIFCWSRYKTGTFAKLHGMHHHEVRNYIQAAGGIQYPCDVAAI